MATIPSISTDTSVKQLLSDVMPKIAREMLAANKNAGELLDLLVLQRNRLRQFMITREILDIVGGAEALR